MNLPSPFSGIVPPLVTPLTGRDQLDHAGLERLIERTLAGGVAGLFILGTTGEGPSLSYRLRAEVIRESCRLVKNRAPVLVGITDTAFVESVALARVAAEAGANAVVAAPPYYLPEGQPELRDYLEDLLPEMPLPFFLYNMPSLTKVSFEVDTIRRFIDDARIAGVKDSSGNMVYFHRLCHLLRDRPDWSIFMGPEELLLDAVLAGAQGGVNGGANLFPALYVALHQAAARGDFARARHLHDVVLEVSSRLYQVGRHPSAIIKGIKCALSLEGVCDDFMAEPFRRFRPEDRDRIAEVLATLKATVTRALSAPTTA
ncbi:MAG: dihydrodipicolinate synthase family protein [Verrucomicrobiales bacterium]|nr:dihydrodipicolinate synthase family protein [Verrucomicrobiales bacterium]